MKGVVILDLVELAIWRGLHVLSFSAFEILDALNVSYIFWLLLGVLKTGFAAFSLHI